MADMVAKGRWWSSKRRTKLTAEQVVQMREEAASGIPQIELARSYSMSIGAVSQIVRGLNWRHVGGPISNHSNNSMTITLGWWWLSLNASPALISTMPLS
jgi:hypothetical protein